MMENPTKPSAQQKVSEESLFEEMNEPTEMTGGLLETHQLLQETYRDGTIDVYKKGTASTDAPLG
jgi:hypothetical protein